MNQGERCVFGEPVESAEFMNDSGDISLINAACHDRGRISAEQLAGWDS